MTVTYLPLANSSAGVVADVTGRVRAGVSLFIYLRGTTTQVQLYSDQGITPLAQPVVTDQYGQVPGLVASPQSVDIHDPASGLTAEVEIIAAADAGGAAAVAVETARAEAAEALLAPLVSPALTGNPTAPTPPALDASTRLATTAYADAADAADKTASGLGLSPQSPIWLTPVKYALINYDTALHDLGNNYTYAAGANGVGATLTNNANGALVADGANPSVGDRVIVSDGYSHGNGSTPHPDGVYTVTATGSVSTPWVLTRATDCDSAANLGRFWAVQITAGTLFGGGQSIVYSLYDQNVQIPFVPGTSFIQFAMQCDSGLAVGPRTTAAGALSVSVGTQSEATGLNSAAYGNTSTASNLNAHAYGQSSVASGQAAHSYGPFSIAAGLNTESHGVSSLAYSNNCDAFASGDVTIPGDAQWVRACRYAKTTDATQTSLSSNLNKPFQFLNSSLAAVWNKTALCNIRIVARRTDVVGTDSAWTAQGVLRGNGSNTYSWVGGSAPVASVVAQDAGASAWAAAISLSSNQLVIQVTGVTGETIRWNAYIELVEVTG